MFNAIYRQTSNKRRALVGSKLVDHRQCSNYVFILHFQPGSNGLVKDNCTTRRETLKFCDWVPLILEILCMYGYAYIDL